MFYESVNCLHLHVTICCAFLDDNFSYSFPVKALSLINGTFLTAWELEIWTGIKPSYLGFSSVLLFQLHETKNRKISRLLKVKPNSNQTSLSTWQIPEIYTVNPSKNKFVWSTSRTCVLFKASLFFSQTRKDPRLIHTSNSCTANFLWQSQELRMFEH